MEQANAMDQQRQEIDRILRTARRIAVVGWSDDPDRPSRSVAEYLSREGYEVLPVNPRLAGTAAFGTTVAATLADLPGKIDLVDIFLRPDRVTGVVGEAIARQVPAVWLQEGVVSEEALAIAREAGLAAVMDRCMMKEHRRLRREGGI
jgi:predicted CoA-binding protein